MLAGEREVLYPGERSQPSRFCALNIEPLVLKPKEGLAIMNGTAVMTGLACLAYGKAAYLAQLCTRITSLAVVALTGNVGHFDEMLFSVKPHPGQNPVAERLRADLNSMAIQSEPSHACRIAIRCVARRTLSVY